MTHDQVAALIAGIADRCTEPCTFDMLAEEVLELHLSLRGKHEDTPAMEWLEIATIAIRALAEQPERTIVQAAAAWLARHS